jgi:hypothetical protein
MRVIPRPGRTLRFLRIEPAHRPFKKWKAVFRDVDTSKEFVRYFGGLHADGTPFPDYTKGATDAQMAHYRRRHKKDLENSVELAKTHNDELYLASPGMLSMEILWGPEPDMKKNIKSYRETYLGRKYLPVLEDDKP